MLIALELLADSERTVLERHGGILSAWTGEESRIGLLDAISHHLPRDRWRLMDGRC